MNENKPIRRTGTIVAIIIFIAITTCFIYFTNQKGYFIQHNTATFLLCVDVIYFLFMCCGISIANRKAKLAKLPILKSHAILIEKIKEDHRQFSNYFLSFELENKSRKLFKVKIDIYASFLENEKGVLTYKEKDNLTELLSFEKENKTP